MSGGVPASLLLPSVGRIELGYPQRRRSLMVMITATVIVGVVSVLCAVAFLLFTYRHFSLVHGYPRLDLLPGAFLSDRYLIQWFLLAFGCIHFVPGLLLVWSLKNVVEQTRRFIHRYVVGVFLLLDAIALVGLFIISGFVCNNSVSGGSICNDATADRYCQAFPDTDYCPPLPGNSTTATPLNPVLLVPNPTFSAFSIWMIIFTLFDLFGILINTLMENTVTSFNYQTQGQGFVRF